MSTYTENWYLQKYSIYQGQQYAPPIYPAHWWESDLPDMQWAADGGGCAISTPRTLPKPDRLTLSIADIASLLEPLSEETKLLLAPMRSIGVNDKILIGVQSNLEHFTIEACRLLPKQKVAERGPCNGWNSPPIRWKERVPASRIDERGRMIAPATDFTVIVLGAIWGDERILFEDDIAKLVFEKLAMQWRIYFLAAKWQAEYKANGTLCELAENLPNPTNLDGTPRLGPDGEPLQLTDYQRVAAACAAIVPGYNFYMEQGTGKTFAAIAAMDYLARKHKLTEAEKLAANPAYKPRPFRVCIVCPKNVRRNWVRELAKFSTTRGLCHTLRGDYLERIKVFCDVVATPSKVVEPVYGYDWAAMVLSYGLLRRDIIKFSGTARRGGTDKDEPIWDLAIVDEGHCIKDSGAQQTKAALELADSAAHRLNLTGTPMPNKVSELFPQLEYCIRGGSGFKSQSAFNKYYQRIVEYFDEGGELRRQIVGIQNTPILQERLARMAFIIRKAEALEGLPPKLFDIREIEMSAEQTALYERVLRDIIVSAERELGGSAGDGRNYNMVIQNVLKQMLRLSQITSGFYVADQMVDDYGEVLQEKEIHRLDPNPKIEALFELIKDRPKTSKAIIWCCWKQTVRTIVARMEYEKLGYVVYTGDTSDHDRAIAEDKFNGDYNTQYFIGIRAAGGVGLNLLGQANDFTNCEGVINVERNWSYKEEAQADDRSHRRGTRVPVTYTSLLVPDSIDEQQYDRIREKRDTAYSVQDVRELLGKLASSIGKLRE